MRNQIIITALFLFIGCNIMAQNSHIKLMLGFSNQATIIRIEKKGDLVKPVFTETALTTLFNQYTIYSMQMAYPASRFPHMHRYYIVECNSVQLMNGINSSFPNLIPFTEVMPEPILLYTPNDFGVNCGSGKARDLDLIRAKNAWDITHGSPSVVIGITDTRFDVNHADFQGKIDTVRSNNSTSPWYHHGTMTAGIIAAKTDNSIGIASVGFNCHLDVSDNYGDDNEMLVISKYGRKILNGSWLNGCYSGSYGGQGIYNEVYENGTIACFGAGNGYEHCHFDKAFPASYDHNISVSSVGSMVPYKQKSNWPGIQININSYVPGCIADPDSMYWCLNDVHENVVGAMDTMSDNTIQKVEVHNHNEKVDIVAPGYAVTGMNYDGTVNCEGGYGTSFASPLVAGTCGLMLSTKPCLTPYQMEYILKNTAFNIYNIPENVQYIGKLGAGRLDAGAAVSMASQYDCNSIYTTTMNIKGVDINTKCVPTFSSNSVLPILTPIIENGTPPYTYKWEADPIDNNVTLDAYNIASPTVISSLAPHRLHLRLTVYDNSQVQKVASKNIQIDLTTTASYDFAMRDSYMDMMDEPNSMNIIDPREDNSWLSPDIWNRQHKDGITSHENAEYYISDSNYVYVKVRNIGCIATPASAKLRMYWTKASTGENWNADWTVANYTNTQTNNTFPAGREITTTPIVIPVLQPGDNVILHNGWRPVKPKDYDNQATSIDVCLLARIEENPTFPFGMIFPEAIPSPIYPNINNNNNVVTRNMSVVDLNPLNKWVGHHILVGNVEQTEQAFDFQLLNEQVINPHFSGDLSSIVEIEIKLGTLFDRWIEAGALGRNIKVNPENKSVIFNGNSLIELNNIKLEPEERLGILILFKYKDGSYSQIPHTLHFRQFLHNDVEHKIYGNVTFEINSTNRSLNKKASQTEMGIFKDDNYAIYPNPAFDIVSIQYLGNRGNRIAMSIKDINGKVIISNKFNYFSQYQVANFDVSQLTTGIYIITIIDTNGVTQNYKFIKK